MKKELRHGLPWLVILTLFLITSCKKDLLHSSGEGIDDAHGM